jgi:D-3-phosphoglycerate dehydrogenase / 2-oxoglutarate reductase
MLVGISDKFRNCDELFAGQGILGDQYKAKGVDFVFFGTEQEGNMPSEVLAKLDVLLVFQTVITEVTANRLTNAHTVVRLGVGYDKVDGKALAKHGIALANNPAYCVDEVADTAIAAIMNFNRNITQGDYIARAHIGTNGRWQEGPLPSKRPQDSTVGIVGLGRIGGLVASFSRSLRFNVIGFDPYKEAGHEKTLGCTRAKTLPELLKTSDFVSLHCPLTPQTRGLIDEDFLRNMKPDAALINTSRGGVLKSLDVLEAHLRGNLGFRAFLDVLPQEPPPSHPLLQGWKDNADWLGGRLLLNRHHGFYSEQSSIEMVVAALETAWLAQEGKSRFVVNDEALSAPGIVRRSPSVLTSAP